MGEQNLFLKFLEEQAKQGTKIKVKVKIENFHQKYIFYLKLKKKKTTSF
jgi:hypothetical protein